MLHAPEASSGEVADLSVRFGSLGEIIAFFVEFKGFAVEAIPPPRGWGTIGEDVSQVRVAALAANFSTHHAVGTVFDFSDVPWREPAVERRPPGAAGEFAGGLKQRQSANHAAVDAVLFVVEEGAAERSFGARSLRDSDLLFGQVFTCLLYTSPSPRDISGSRMPSSA